MPPVAEDNSEALLNIVVRQGAGNVENVNSGSALAVSAPSAFSTSVITLNGAAPVLTLPAPFVGMMKKVFLVQDTTGSRMPSYVCPGGTVKWVGATAPTLQTAAGSVDSIIFESYDGVNIVGKPALHIA